MSKIIKPLCFWCKNLDYSNGPYECKAFESKNYRIPTEIWRSKFDHRYSHPSDNGITFEKLDTEALLHQKHFLGLTEKEIKRYFEGKIKYLDLAATTDVPDDNFSEDDDIFW